MPSAAPIKRSRASAASARTGKTVLLAGGNPQVAKGDGDASVQAYIAAIPGWKREVGRLVDRLVVEACPDVRKAIKWNSAFYGSPNNGWFLSFHCYTKYVKVAFFNGTLLRPVPPGESKQARVRYLDLYENVEVDQEQFRDWVTQARHLPAWKMASAAPPSSGRSPRPRKANL